MSITMNELYNKLDWRLKQEIETGDFGDADKFRVLPVEDAIDVTNEACLFLMRDNIQKFEKEMTHVFSSDVYEWQAPSDVHSIVAGKAYASGKRWEIFRGSSFDGEAIRVVSDNKIINTDGWEKGDTLKLIVIEKPNRIIEASDLIDRRFDDYQYLLKLKIKQIALGNDGEAFSQIDNNNLMMELNQWRMEMNQVKRKHLRRQNLRSYGRRR